MGGATASKRAVVIGGSMAGLLAARALADHFAEVTIVERGSFPEAAEFRPSAPQGRHAHVILERGRRIIEAFLPGLSDEMLAAGARMIDAAQGLSWLSWFGESVRAESDLTAMLASRLMLEHHVRRRVLAWPRVATRVSAPVAALAGSSTKVTGVRLADGEQIEADFVVDASGRESGAPRWLEALGVTPPTESTIEPHIGYATRWYQAPPTKMWDRDFVVATARPPHYTRTMFMCPVENNRYIVTMAGACGDHPPTDEEGLAAFTRSLEIPGLADWLGAAQPLGPIYGFRFEQSRLRHFERCALPAGFVAVGDAVVSFNPIYGQGMTTAALGIELLAELLGKPSAPATLPRRFHRRLAKLLAPAWQLTTSEDLRFPATEGARTLSHKIMYAYIDRVFLLSTTSPAVRHALLSVQSMLEPPTHLFKPSILWRVLRTRIPSDRVRPQHGLMRRT